MSRERKAQKLRTRQALLAGARDLAADGRTVTVAEAAQDAYAAVDKIDWEDAYIRRDIGHRAIARERA